VVRIGFTFNIKDPAFAHTDTHAEYETRETVDAIAEVLSAAGEVIPLPCDRNLISALVRERPDLVFNIAEGWGGRDRETFVPALCAMLGIPCTGSDAVTLGLTMDKALTKRALRDAGVRTADFVLCRTIPHLPPQFGFPAFVKPNCDGSSRGISRSSLVKDMEELVGRVRVVLEEYGQPALVEPYLDGRDFCAGLLGRAPQRALCTRGGPCNDPPELLTTCEVLLGHEEGIPFFSFEYKRRDIDRLDMAPDIFPATIRGMEETALAAWETLGCRDYTRIDFRTDSRGIPYLLEVNALPGLSPVSGIIVRQAEASGIPFDALIRRILARAAGNIRVR
jgi:D-alanine-D-alanine ligase